MVPRGQRLRLPRLPWQRQNEIEAFTGCADWLPADGERPPLLDIEQFDLFDRDRHPFYRDAEAELFLARRGGQVVGRVAAIVSHHHNAFERSRSETAGRTGFFGFYEAIEDHVVADALLDVASEWLRARGMVEMVGPASPSHNYYYGARALDEETVPYSPTRFLEAYSPPRYHDHYLAWGLTVERRMFGFDCDLDSPEVARVIERFEATIAKTVRSTGLRIRPMDVDDFDDEITRVNEMINRSLAENWGFSPMSRDELAYMGEQLKPLIDPALVLIAELEGEPVGISLALPDYNQVFAAMDGRLSKIGAAFTFDNIPLVRRLWPRGHAWQSRSIDTARVIALGIVPTVGRRGATTRREMLRIGPALVYSTLMNARRAEFRWLTASWILEDNKAMLAPFAIAGIPRTRVWRMYRRAL